MEWTQESLGVSGDQSMWTREESLGVSGGQSMSWLVSAGVKSCWHGSGGQRGSNHVDTGALVLVLGLDDDYGQMMARSQPL